MEEKVATSRALSACVVQAAAIAAEMFCRDCAMKSLAYKDRLMIAQSVAGLPPACRQKVLS